MVSDYVRGGVGVAVGKGIGGIGRGQEAPSVISRMPFPASPVKLNSILVNLALCKVGSM